MLLAASSVLAACPSPRPAPSGGAAPPAAKPPVDEDREACVRLCAHERACGAVQTSETTCQETCEADVRRMKPGFVAAFVRCFVPELDRRCGDGGAFGETDREAAHDRCFDAAVSAFPRDDASQRDMAEAVCDRGDRCQGLGKVGRDACLQATLDPQEPEVKRGQRLVDALRRARAQAFRACVDQAPCPALDHHDDAVDDCYRKTIAGGAG